MAIAMRENENKGNWNPNLELQELSLSHISFKPQFSSFKYLWQQGDFEVTKKDI